MRPNRADSALSQYFCSLLTAVLLLVSLLCGLIFFATTRTFAASVLSSSEKESQHKTEWNAAQIQADFALSDAALAPCPALARRIRRNLRFIGTISSALMRRNCPPLPPPR